MSDPTYVTRLQTMMDAAKIQLPVHIEYDEDGGGEYQYSRWAWRIKDVVNFVEETNETWPELGHADGLDPRAEYVAAALNAMPALLSELVKIREDRARLSAALRDLIEAGARGSSEFDAGAMRAERTLRGVTVKSRAPR